MRRDIIRAAAAGFLAAGLMAQAPPALAELSLHMPDDGITPTEPSPDPMLDEPIVRRAKPKPETKTAPEGKAAAPVKRANAAAPPAPPEAAPAKPAKVAATDFRRCADSYFAGASLLRTDPNAVDVLLQRAQISGERHLKASAASDQDALVQAIKMSGTARAAEIRALDSDAGPKAAQHLFRVIRQCDAALGLTITGPLTFGAPATLNSASSAGRN